MCVCVCVCVVVWLFGCLVVWFGLVGFSLVWLNSVWFGLVWIFNFDLVWGLPWSLWADHSPQQTLKTCIPQTMDGQKRKKQKNKKNKTNGVGYRVAAQLKKPKKKTHHL